MNYEIMIKKNWKTFEEMESLMMKELEQYCESCENDTDWKINSIDEDMVKEYENMVDEFYEDKKENDKIIDFETRNDELHNLLLKQKITWEIECLECGEVIEIDVNPIWGLNF